MKVTNDILKERVLVERVKTGDESAFKMLFDMYNTRLCLWAYKITNDHEAAKDIVQNFFIRYWNKKEILDFSPSFASYAYRSIYNSSLNYLRDHEKYVYDITQINIPENNSDEEIDDPELHGQLMRAIDELPDKCRKIFMMVAFERRKYSEVADHFGISANTVKVQVSKAYHILRKKISIFFFLFF